MEGQNPNSAGDSIDARKTDVGLPRFPPGFRFYPRDDELVRHYLMRKIAGQPLPYNVINDVNILEYHPQMLCEKFKGFGEKKWYFFTARDRKYGFGYRPERTTPYGFWKASGLEKMIQFNKAIIGRRRGLVFYSMISNKKTNWVMHEYLIYDGSKKPPSHKSTKQKAPKPPKQLNKWVLCTIREKPAPKPKKGTKAPKKDTEADDKSNVNNGAIIQDQPTADGSGPSSSLNMKKKLPKAPPKVRKRKNCSPKQATEGQDVTPVAAKSSSETFNYSQPAETFPQNYDHQSQGNFMSMDNFDRLFSFQQNSLEKVVGDLSHLSYHDLQMLYQQSTNRGYRMDKLTPISGNTMSMHSIDQQHTLQETVKDRREVAHYPTPIIGGMGMQNLNENHFTHEIANAEQNYPQPDQSCWLDNNNQFEGITMITQNCYQQGILQKNSGEDLRIDIQQDDSYLLSKSATFVHNDFNYGCLPNSENWTSNTYFNSAT